MTRIPQPPAWAKPRGFSNGIAAKGGTAVYLAGQLGWTGAGVWKAKDFAGQFRQALRNILEVLAQAGASRAPRSPDLVRHRLRGVPRLARSGRRRVPRADGQALSGHDGGSGERPRRERCAPGNRGDRGHAGLTGP